MVYIAPTHRAGLCKREIRFQLKLTLSFLIHQVLKVIHTDKFNGVSFPPKEMSDVKKISINSATR